MFPVPYSPYSLSLFLLFFRSFVFIDLLVLYRFLLVIGGCTWFFLSLFSFNIIPKGFLFPCSSVFLLSISIFLLSIPLIYLILKWYLDNISVYLTYFWFSSLVNSSLISINNSFYFIPHFYSLSFFIILVNSSIFSDYFTINLL